jgi:hypothetical protein
MPQISVSLGAHYVLIGMYNGMIDHNPGVVMALTKIIHSITITNIVSIQGGGVMNTLIFHFLF